MASLQAAQVIDIGKRLESTVAQLNDTKALLQKLLDTMNIKTSSRDTHDEGVAEEDSAEESHDAARDEDDVDDEDSS
jgi:hypothetical protein